MWRTVIACSLTIACAAPALLWAQTASSIRRDGRWDVAMELQVNGLPPGSLPTMKTTQCISKDDAADPNKALPSPPQTPGAPPAECKMTEQKIEGNKVSWSMACTGATPMAGTGEVLYIGDTFVGFMTLDLNGSQTSTMTMKYAGRRLGDCIK